MTCMLVDERQKPQFAGVLGGVLDEIVGPDVVGVHRLARYVA